jgi:hypothetical protein
MGKNTIYRLNSDPDKFAWLKIESKNWQEYSRQILGPKTKPVARSWVAPTVKLSSASKGKMGDFPSLGPGAYTVCSEKAWNLLRPLIGSEVELLPIGKLSGQNFYIIHVLAEIDALDQTKSKFFIFEGERGGILEYVFHDGAIEEKHIFRIPEALDRVFISEAFKKIVDDNGLVGAKISLVYPKSSSKLSPKAQPKPSASRKTARPKAWTLPALEREFKIALPEAYRQILENYPADLSAAQYSDNPKMGGPSNFELHSDLQRIGELNLELRKLWPDSDFADTPFPDSYFLIGEDGGGNYFAVDTAKSKESPVYEFDHEESVWNRRAKSLREFADQLIKFAEKVRKSEKKKR